MRPRNVSLPEGLWGQGDRLQFNPTTSAELAPRVLTRSGGRRREEMMSLPFSGSVLHWKNEVASQAAKWKPPRVIGFPHPPTIEQTARRLLLVESPDQQELHLELYPVPTLPAEIGQLTHLRSILIFQGGLQSLPESVGNLHELTELKLFHNPINTLPASLPRLEKLRELSIGFSPDLRSLPKNLWASEGTQGQPGLQGLQTLNLTHTGIATLPDSLVHSRRLETLSVRHSPLQALPARLGDVHSLRNLQIEHTPITRLPESLVNLAHLGSLKLGHNPQLSALPEPLGKLSRLRHLDLRGCSQLARLPESISQLHADCEIRVPDHLRAQLNALRPPSQPLWGH